MTCLVAPKIDRKNLRSVTIKEGESFSFDVKIIGEPAPDVTWTFASKMIQQTSTRRIEDVPYNTKFFNDKAERKDSGTYTITAVNKYGQDVAEVEVTVVCKCHPSSSGIKICLQLMTGEFNLICGELQPSQANRKDLWK